MAQLVERPTFDLRSGQDLVVYRFEPCVGLCADSSDLLGILSLPLSAFSLLMLALCLSLKINK